MKRYYWSGISSDERIKAIIEINDIINRFATISNFQKYSDISLSLVLEVEECKLSNLQIGLRKIMALDGMDAGSSDSKADCMVLLGITFAKGTGDLKIEVPNMPE